MSCPKPIWRRVDSKKHVVCHRCSVEIPLGEEFTHTEDGRPIHVRCAPWCCMCGAVQPDGLEVCPVSEREMGEGRGLTHLLAYSRHKRAMEVYERCAAVREALSVPVSEREEAA